MEDSQTKYNIKKMFEKLREFFAIKRFSFSIILLNR